MKHIPATPLFSEGAVPAASMISMDEAIDLAISDHRSGPITDWEFVDALRAAKRRANAYPRLVAELHKAVRQFQPGSGVTESARALLAELGE